MSTVRASRDVEIDQIVGYDQMEALARAEHDNPFAFLGAHAGPEGWTVRAFLPGAETVALVSDTVGRAMMTKAHEAGVFVATLGVAPGRYRLDAQRGGDAWSVIDPYQFQPLLGELDEHLLGQGAHQTLWRALGAGPTTHEGVDGARFAVWAPNAKRVSVVGDFNEWDGRRHPMRNRGATGVWELFVPDVVDGARYKYEILGADGEIALKSDPVGVQAAMRPDNVSVLRGIDGHAWGDADWMASRGARQRVDQPLSIYEVHLGSWRRRENGDWLSYAELAETLVPYVKDMGFTHIECLPLSEHPFDGSWGYQPIGLYAPTKRFGDYADFQRFIDACHQAELGVILDWVPGHFPSDAHGLTRFDGTPLYEHADPREGFHHDWNTLIYNFGRSEVANYLIANAHYWLREHHIDALRVDAVASMIYRDYSRKDGEWVPNADGGNENLEAISLLRRLNAEAYGADPSIMTMAEESTAFPGVTAPAHDGGLGFGFKWNMGWMNDTLEFMSEDPLYRRHHHGKMSFGIHYAFSENYVLPLSHDEVVHGKGSILGRMPGDRWSQFANLRAYYAFMFAHPGKKLLFMGQEFGQECEWKVDQELPWASLDEPLHRGVRDLVRDLNRLYRETPALYAIDNRPEGFEWIDGASIDESVYAWVRWGGHGRPPVLAAFNFSGVEHRDWRLGAPAAGYWREVINTDATLYGGGGRGNLGGKRTDPISAHGREQSLELTLPPLSGVILTLEPNG